jgi:glycosyltransferase involved in cell wall biosynthesis
MNYNPMDTSPLISIIIPAYNRGHLIKETLNSVLNQSYSQWECIVVDDGSTDNTRQVVEAFSEKDARFRYFERPGDLSKGANSCRNFGFRKSSGTFINWLDSDDLLSEDKLTAQVEALKQSKDPYQAVVSSKWNRFSQSTAGIAPREAHINRNFSSGLELLMAFNKRASFFPCHAYLVSRSLVERAGLWDEQLLVNQDGEFFTRILIQAKEVLHPHKGMVYYRTPEAAGVSTIGDRKKMESSIQSWKLIAKHLNKAAPDANFPYLEHAKNYLFEKIGDQTFLKEHRDFFKAQFNRRKLWPRLLRKVKGTFTKQLKK